MTNPFQPEQTASESPIQPDMDAGQALLNTMLTRTASAPRKVDGIATGRFDGFTADGVPLVSIAALGLSAIAARSMAALDKMHPGAEIALGFEGGDALQPIILGVMLRAMPASAPEPTPEPTPMELVIDGQRVTIQAEHTLELRCGLAALIMHADGRIDSRGTHITSHASATMRILGGSISLN